VAPSPSRLSASRHTVTITTSAAYSSLLSLLAFSNSACTITPKGNLGDQLKAIVGTGPYKLIEHKPDKYIRLGRFDGYRSRTEPSDAAFGKRNCYLDEIRFVPVPDTNTRHRHHPLRAIAADRWRLPARCP
jgi:peptide/nickel transport system substrate-binding protein